MNRIKYWSVSHEGMKRKLNEDYHAVIERDALAVLCDGMGGHVGGDIASRMVVETVEYFFDNPFNKKEIAKILDDGLMDLPEEVQRLILSIRLGNRRIFSTILRQRQLAGMGTTIVSSIFFNDTLYTCHVGDSRLYRIRNKKITQITKDHSWLNELLDAKEITPEQAATFTEKNVITRAVGIDPAVRIEVTQTAVQAHDVYLWCSDGLTDVISDEEIVDILYNNDSAEQALKQLVKDANHRGGPDNITIIIGLCDASFPPLASEAIKRQTAAKENDETQDLEDKMLRRLFGETQIADLPSEVKKHSRAYIYILFGLLLLAAAAAGYFYDSLPFFARPPHITAYTISSTPDSCAAHFILNGVREERVTPFQLEVTEGDTVQVFFSKPGYLIQKEKLIGNLNPQQVFPVSMLPQLKIQIGGRYLKPMLLRALRYSDPALSKTADEKIYPVKADAYIALPSGYYRLQILDSLTQRRLNFIYDPQDKDKQEEFRITALHDSTQSLEERTITFYIDETSQ